MEVKNSKPSAVPLVDVSLDSVLQKANELARILQTCKQSLENQHSPGNWGRGSSTLLKRSDSAPQSPTVETGPPPSTVPNDVLVEQWHQLTSYIVSLEKEVQCYKQLIEECGQAQTNNGKTDTDVLSHTQNNEEEKQSDVEPDLQEWDRLIEGDSMNQALLFVFGYLSTRELCAVSRVCQRWAQIVKHPKLWRNVDFTETVLDPQVLQRLSTTCIKTEKISLHGLMPPMTAQDEDLSSYITRTRGSLEEALKDVFKNCGQTLVSISFTECNLMITDKILWLMSIYCPNVKSLSYTSEEFPPSAEALWSLTNGCQSIQHLYLPPVLGSPFQDSFNDDALRTIATGWSNLVSLTVGGSFISVNGLAEISRGCPHLCFLEIIYGPGIDKKVVEQLCEDNGLSSLTSLVLNFTPSTHLALEHLLECRKQLQRVDLHITLHTYFTPTEASRPDNIDSYEAIVKNLKKLEKQNRGRNVFHLFEHYTRA